MTAHLQVSAYETTSGLNIMNTKDILGRVSCILFCIAYFIIIDFNLLNSQLHAKGVRPYDGLLDV